MFGGFANGSPDSPSHPLSDTWVFAGRRWMRLTPRHSPAARGAARCGWDGHELLLYGGSRRYGSTDLFGDTWAWTGSDWLELHPVTSPATRLPAAFGYDDSHLVLFGGWNPATSQSPDGLFSDTWIWQDGTWRQEHNGSGPGARGGSGCATWAGHGLLVNGGGRNVPLNDTWLHTMQGWRQLQAAGGSAPYGGAAAPLGRDVLMYTSGREPTELWHEGHWTPVKGPEPPQTSGEAVAELGPSAVLMFGGTPPEYSNTTFASTYIYRPPSSQAAPQPRHVNSRPASPRPAASPSIRPSPVASEVASPTSSPTPSSSATPVAVRLADSRGGLARPVALVFALIALLASGLARVWARALRRP
jgi:hypothetical protein